MNKHHRAILRLVKQLTGKPTQHTFSDAYLGNSHPRYPISNPVMRKIAREWMREHRALTAHEFAETLTSLVKGKSSTEKMMAGMLLDYASPAQRKFDPALFDAWLDHLEGWAEVDTLCTGKYPARELLPQWKAWRPLLLQFARSSDIEKRRASLVLFCSPFSKHDDARLATVALQNIGRLKKEKHVLITKAISWVLRSMVKHHRGLVYAFIDKHRATLPAIAVRETLIKLDTGVKARRR